MRDHHVPIGPRLLIEAGALAEREFLRHVDLHVVDEIAVPDRLEQSVRESKRQNVLCGFLAEKVIDTKDSILVEHFMQAAVEGAGSGKVRAERLLHDHARSVDEFGLAEQANRGERSVRWHAEVVQALALTAE